ncbi:hypothetical protein Bateq7PJ16_0781 [Bacillus subtilis]|nr:hypothetical protein Bateq7PJ16_0781 [Bacillus subtilis]
MVWELKYLGIFPENKNDRKIYRTVSIEAKRLILHYLKRKRF